jgi:4-guanidinobutyraldehyde dehydrogenase / NAD-dependent aldehyde dehydrogenase
MSGRYEGIDWHERARALQIRGEALINGRRVAAQGGATFPSLSPIDGRQLALVAAGDTADVDAAVSAARATFERGDWARQPPAARKRVLQDFAARVEAAGEELALLETLDMGKPISDALAVDVPATARCLRWYGEAIDKIYGEVAPTAPDALALITREPVGVVGAIVPWNFPMIMAAWKIAPVLAAGNSLVLKPSEKSPLSALRLAELALEAGVPPGVFSVVPGFGHTAGKALALHMDVDAIAFTGSTATGKLIAQYGAQSNLKRVSLECGGKSPNIVMADYPDLKRAVLGRFTPAGAGEHPRCAAGGNNGHRARPAAERPA